MADYKELLRRAVEALPENNGAARRAVYEKARAALVGQLRAINPPLAARDITAHRLQLEDCIRQVEQEASEAVIAGLGTGREDAPPPPPVYFDPPVKKATPGAVARPMAKPPASGPVVKPPTNGKEPPKPLPPGGSIEEIIAAANAEQPAAAAESKPRGPARGDGKPMGRPVPKLVPPTQTRPQPAAAAAAPAPAPTQIVPPPRATVLEEPEDDQDELAAALAELSTEPEEEVEEAFVPPPPPPPQPKARVNGRPLPAIVAKAEAAKSRTSSSAFGAPINGPARGPVLEPRREAAVPRLEPAAARGAGRPVAAQRVAEPAALFDEPPVPAAMSAVREVEVEDEVEVADPQIAIDRAIATLDREARGELDDDVAEHDDIADIADEEPEDEAPVRQTRVKNGFAPTVVSEDAPSEIRRGRPERAAKPPKPVKEKPERSAKPERPAKPDRPARTKGHRALTEEDEAVPFARPREDDRRGMGAVTIFLIVFAFLLAGSGGAAFWAWREGFIDFDQMFGRAAPVQQQAAATPNQATEATVDVPATGPGNTDTPTVDAPAPELDTDERLGSEAATLSPAEPLPLVPAAPVEERLDADSAPAANSAAAAVAAIDPASVPGSQSLLLEASDNGTTGAVPFSGTVDWTRGTDEMGLPTLVGKASIPARNLGVDVLIRKNSDPSLPASHLMEINFRVSEGFIGGSIAGLPGVLLKNEELVRGQQLVGASARVVGNSFLFALSASPEDVATNNDLLTSRKWMDLALIYATGKRAIITLEKDDAATAMFNEVVDSWTQTAAASP